MHFTARKGTKTVPNETNGYSITPRKGVPNIGLNKGRETTWITSKEAEAVHPRNIYLRY
jgi:hypothetical protein